MKVLIIGGGASGVICAIKLKQIDENIDVTVMEKNNKILKKLSVTGAGKCNLYNLDISPDSYTNFQIVKSLQDNNYESEVQSFFTSIGLLTTSEHNRVYPVSEDAKSVCDLLNNYLFMYKIKVVLNKEVTEIKEANGKYIVDGVSYDYVIVSTGSNAGSKEDSNSYYKLLNNLGINLKNLKHGLVGFKIKENISDLFGIRAKAKVRLNDNSSFGEVNFKADGISGICVMDLSIRDYKIGDLLYLDLLPSTDKEFLDSIVKQKLSIDKNLKLYNVLTGLLNRKLLAFYNSQFENKKVMEMDLEELDNYFSLIKNYPLTIAGVYPISDAQVVVGGVEVSSLADLEIKKNMFVTGEALNNAGICGGFNLWFAFATGLFVANKIGGKKHES